MTRRGLRAHEVRTPPTHQRTYSTTEPAPTTRTINANGLTFACDEMGEGDAVALCLHGFPESRFSWRHQLPALARAGWRAVAPDMRGYGDSSRPEEKQAYAMDHLVADAAALFDAYAARRRLLVAHDWGALVAWTFAMRQARPLDGLIIMNVPHPQIFGAVLSRSWRQKVRSWYVAFFQLPAIPEFGLTAFRARAVRNAFRDMAIDKSAFPADVLDHYCRNALRPGAMTAMINYYRANFNLLGADAAAPVIETPTLMIWGEEDKALGLELTEGYGPYVRDFELKRLPNVSHWVQQEAPSAVNAHMGDWLARKGLSLA
jgi:epoxide hydrolase 4